MYQCHDYLARDLKYIPNAQWVEFHTQLIPRPSPLPSPPLQGHTHRHMTVASPPHHITVTCLDHIIRTTNIDTGHLMQLPSFDE